MTNLTATTPLTFNQTLAEQIIALRRATITTMQINLGKTCNQTCRHCHVAAGPHRTESMNRETAERILTLLAASPTVTTLDITGGAPEINPNFRFLVSEARKLGKHVLNRCNLTVLFEAGQEDTASFLAEQHVEVIASLPCYLEENVCQQRGDGVFAKSIAALQLLNSLGYGTVDSLLRLNLVYNPSGGFLPPAQNKLEDAYKAHLGEHYGIVFNNLYTIANMPITRYRDLLQHEGALDGYLQLLRDNFNLAAAHHLMCTSQISIGYDGTLYDCDFNQALELPAGNQLATIFDIASLNEITHNIATAEHCFGCTAGAGSSCGGALA
ncbi:arsenosugar biosynthesis radical SAM (seleno)protein ArsS [Chrysiogenes arsenatis]|uniref:arsenosugar biosynthesis radical SAM (seleno)protein ArsS n=1 Tax=Chrysiogenes arsenatis TaxID=309797 RepID=UPI0003FB435E|nr:arsenosugar biosynthesis radical SAM (seleno)protein ArsS [Chrysiogenes arsenatis]